MKYVARETFLETCFNMREDEIQTDKDPTTLDSTNKDSEQSVSGVVLRHRLNEVDLRRTAINFGRCFLSGSVAGYSLRKNSAKELRRTYPFYSHRLRIVNIKKSLPA